MGLRHQWPSPPDHLSVFKGQWTDEDLYQRNQLCKNTVSQTLPSPLSGAANEGTNQVFGHKVFFFLLKCETISEKKNNKKTDSGWKDHSGQKQVISPPA